MSARDHSCEVCGNGGMNDDEPCVCDAVDREQETTMPKPKTIKIDDVEYVRADTIQPAEFRNDEPPYVREALDLIYRYGGIDGDHHKQWVLDQVVRVLADDYARWVEQYNDGEDGPDTYLWDEGIAP